MTAKTLEDPDHVVVAGSASRSPSTIASRVRMDAAPGSRQPVGQATAGGEDDVIRGRCLCGTVAWESGGPVELVNHCHCTRCRKAHGSAFATYGGVPEASFRFTDGGDPSTLTRYASSAGLVRPFCSTCGSPVPGDALEGRVFVPLGLVEGDPGARPVCHIFAGSRAPWYAIAGELPAFDGWPDGFEFPVAPELERELAPAGRTRGSCLCDAVAFELEGPPRAFRNCHCSLCRRARGAAHASNAFYDADRFRWLRGESEVEVYGLPGHRFSQAFCRTCGGKVPRHVPERGVAVVPAGCLDGDPGGRPSDHIFVGSKAPWFEIEDDLPRFDGFPD